MLTGSIHGRITGSKGGAGLEANIRVDKDPLDLRSAMKESCNWLQIDVYQCKDAVPIRIQDQDHADDDEYISRTNLLPIKVRRRYMTI